MNRIFDTEDVIDVPCIWDALDAYRTTLYAFGADKATVDSMVTTVMERMAA
jgi:hypothetical protein